MFIFAVSIWFDSTGKMSPSASILWDLFHHVKNNGCDQNVQVGEKNSPVYATLILMKKEQIT